MEAPTVDPHHTWHNNQLFCRRNDEYGGLGSVCCSCEKKIRFQYAAPALLSTMNEFLLVPIPSTSRKTHHSATEPHTIRVVFECRSCESISVVPPWCAHKYCVWVGDCTDQNEICPYDGPLPPAPTSFSISGSRFDVKDCLFTRGKKVDCADCKKTYAVRDGAFHRHLAQRHAVQKDVGWGEIETLLAQSCV